MRLSELKTGEKGVIVKVRGHGGFRKRIVEMGFIKGKTAEVLLNAPLKDPIKYRVMGYEVSLRRKEAEMIEIISEEEAEEQTRGLTYQEGLSEDIHLSDEELKELALGKRRTINVALVGNPNCGKTSLFNIASGAHERVGNYGGVTIDAKEGHFDFQGYHFRLIDLPGTYSLSTYSPEELFVRRHIINETPDVIINVVDSSNIERNLYLTTQLIDMNVRIVVALNMYDELEASGNKLDYIKLSQLLGVPMVPTVCCAGKGIEQLLHVVIHIYEGADFLDDKGNMNAEIADELRNWHKNYVPDHAYGSKKEMDEHKTGVYRHIHINHGPEIERSIDEVKRVISVNENIRHKYSTRFLAIKLLENDKDLESFAFQLPNGQDIIDTRNKEAKRLREVLGEDSEQAITDAKYAYIAGALRETYKYNSSKKAKTSRTDKIDALVTHRIWGYPLFILFILIMFEATFGLGQYPMDGIEWLVAKLGNVLQVHMTEGPLKDLLIDGIIGGVGAVIVFLPNIIILYLFISFMEDSGYMARAAFMMDKMMHGMGLHGKSFIPMIMGFGCSVPAVMSTRTIESRKSRLITMLVTPFMSCSARLPIYLVLVGTFFPRHGALVLFSLYFIGVLVAIIMSRVYSRFLIKGEDVPFVMELPPYRMPSAKSVLRHTWEKCKQYLRKMGTVILVASVVIWALGYFPHKQYATQAEQQENSYLGKIGIALEPVVKPLNFDWKMGVSLLAGVSAKEIVVSSLGVLYANDSEADSTTLGERMNITPLTAYGYMVFVLLYFPCIATLVAIKEESGSHKWAWFEAIVTTVIAWIMSFLVFQIGSFFS